MSRAASHRSPARFDVSVLASAKPGALPRICRAVSSDTAPESPSGKGWVHEIRFDGCRAQAHLRNGRPAVYTRAGSDWTLRFQTIADALATLAANELILDGEAVVVDSRGVPEGDRRVFAIINPIGRPTALSPSCRSKQPR
jgi:bifunctional non-homologous end joining protein LigD